MSLAEGTPFVSDVELENIKRIFQQFDKDHSESIDVEELKEVMASLGVLMDDVHLTELVEQVTTADKEELNFNEFLSLITLWKEASQYKLFDGKGFKSLAQQHVEKALETQCLVPDAPWRAGWDVVICFTALTYWIWVLLIDAYTHDRFNVTWLIVFDIILTLLLFTDSAMCARTCFMQEVRLQDDPKQVLVHYAKTWMVPDILASIPFDLMLTAAGAPVAADVLRHLRLIKIIKIPFLWQSSGSVPITSRYIQFYFHVLPIFQLLLIFIIMVHGFAIGWILLKQSSCTDDLMDLVTCKYPYTPAVYFVLYTLSTVGLGDIPVTGDSEQWYASFVLCGAMATNGIVIGKLVAILQRADIKKERRAKLRETLAVLDHFSIPKQLQEEILQFQAHVFEHNLGAAYEGIVSGLPQEMRVNISLFVKMKLVTNVPMFVQSHYMLRIAVAQSLENAVARPEQYIIVCGQESDGLYFLAYGFADIFNADGAYDGTQRSGDFFGEGALMGENVQSISVKAITYCDLWVLSKAQFNQILKRFPKFQRHVEELKQAPEGATAVNPLKTAAGSGATAIDTTGDDDTEMMLTDVKPDSKQTSSDNNMGAILAPRPVPVAKKMNGADVAVTGGGGGGGGGGSKNARNVARLKNLLQTVTNNKMRLQKALKATNTARKVNETQQMAPE